MLTLYVDKYDAWWISRHQKVLRIKICYMELSSSYREVSTAKWPRWIEKLSRIYWAYKNFLDGSRSCWAVIETNSQKPRWIEITITAIEKGSLKSLIDSLAIKRYWEVVEIAQKQFFKEEKNTNKNAIKHATQPRIQTTFWILKIIFQQEKCQAFSSKTHTHTH